MLPTYSLALELPLVLVLTPIQLGMVGRPKHSLVVEWHFAEAAAESVQAEFGCYISWGKDTVKYTPQYEQP